LAPKLIVSSSSAPKDHTELLKYQKYKRVLKNTVISSEWMVSGPSCPVWVVEACSSDAESNGIMYENSHLNYLLVKFLSLEAMEKSLGSPEDYSDIRDQVRFY
jgi:hypothetical protein